MDVGKDVEQLEDLARHWHNYKIKVFLNYLYKKFLDNKNLLSLTVKEIDIGLREVYHSLPYCPQELMYKKFNADTKTYVAIVLVEDDKRPVSSPIVVDVLYHFQNLLLANTLIGAYGSNSACEKFSEFGKIELNNIHQLYEVVYGEADAFAKIKNEYEKSCLQLVIPAPEDNISLHKI